MNCVLIVIDGLAKADLELIHQSCPSLSRIITAGDRYENVYTNGCPTEFALPGIFASDWLLNNSDRWAGLKNKKLTAAEFFTSKSFASAAFSPVYRPTGNDYKRGYSYFFNPYCARTLAKEIDQSSSWFLDEFLCGRITYECFKDNLLDLLNESLAGLAGLDPDYAVDPLLMEDLLIELQDQPGRVVEGFLRTKKLRILDVIEEIVKTRIMSQRNYPSVLFLYAVVSLMSIVFGGKKRLNLLRANIRRLFGSRRSKSKFSSAETLVDKYVGWLSQQTKQTFTFLHLLDYHEKNYFKFESGSIKAGWLIKLFRFIISNRGQMEKIHHLMSLFYIDHQVKRVLSVLEGFGDHMVILTSDHGNIEFSDKPHVFHKTFDFSDQYYRIPFVIYKSQVAGKANNNLGSSIDIIPTIIWDLFSEEESLFFGLPLQKCARDYVFFENTGRGPSSLVLKPVYLALKSKATKIKVRFYLNRNSNKELVLYGDLLDVCDELDRPLPFSSVIPKDLNSIAARLKQIYTGIGKYPSLVLLRVGHQEHELS